MCGAFFNVFFFFWALDCRSRSTLFPLFFLILAKRTMGRQEENQQFFFSSLYFFLLHHALCIVTMVFSGWQKRVRERSRRTTRATHRQKRLPLTKQNKTKIKIDFSFFHFFTIILIVSF